ncbi:MAG: N-6 DNA methylase [Bacteroidetes bacterium]|nr:N-6 DNA methylase [Bacteroidota bacterium]
MQTNPSSLVKKTVEILGSVDYSKYSRTKNYEEYVKQAHSDERKLIQPILFRKFLEHVLGFTLGGTIWAEQSEEGNVPNFLPVDTFTHPFLFDTKSTAVTEQTIKKHIPQISRYIRFYKVRYGVLTNMREMDVYTVDSHEELTEFDFSFLTLYKDFKYNKNTVLEKENTNKFLHFVETFSYCSLDAAKKIERICNSAGWVGNETLNVNHLTLKLKQIVEWFEKDALNQKGNIELFPEHNPDLAKDIVRELDFISKEIDPSLADTQSSITPERLHDYLNALPKTTQARALNIYFYRVAYFTMARILLARMWEDIGFIESTLTDGGFEKWYQNLGKEIRQVLNQAFQFAGAKYQWLYRTPNNYTWYEPSEPILVDALYELANFYLGALKDDALGMIYEQELDIIDKQNKGQYYTDRNVIRFMWDRVGFTNNDAFFNEEKKKYIPKKIIDVAVGSGGFLVEAARRIREMAFPQNKSFEDVELMRRAILFGLFGMEISPFPYYITEINLLIQLTPVIREMSVRKQAIIKEGTPIAVVQGDSLTLYNDAVELFIKEETGTYNVGNHLIRFGRDSAKQKIFEKIYTSNDFDYCLANPPYIREDDHKELFRRTKGLPIGREFYQGKMDYYHFFIELGLSKLRQNGLLCFITTSYWLTAVGASNLRRYILDNAIIKEVIHFGPTKLFESAKGQFNVIFVLEKKNTKLHAEARKKNSIKIAQVKELFSPNVQENILKLFKHLAAHIGKKEYSDEYIDVYDSATAQGELTNEEWHLFIHKKHKNILKTIEKAGKPLDEFCTINQGLVSGADSVTRENIELLTHSTIEEYDIKQGDGIFYVKEDEIHKKIRPTPKDLELIKRIFKTSEVTGYLPSNMIYSDLKCLYVNKETKIKDYTRIYEHLKKFRNILERKREFQEGKLPWYSMHWARSKDIFSGKIIIVSVWPTSNIFGYSEGEYYGERNIFLIKLKNNITESIKYILGVLNSKVIEYYFEHKGSKRGDKYFFPKEFCQKLPIKPIKTKEEQKLHDKIVELVDKMIDERSKLLELTRYITDTQFINKKYFVEKVPPLNDKAIVSSLGWGGARPLKRNDAISYTLGQINPEQFTLAKVNAVGETLLESRATIRLMSVDGSVVEVKGEKQNIDLLNIMLEDYKNKTLKEILDDVELPLDLNLLTKKKAEISNQIKSVAKQITKLQESTDKIVMKLYNIEL